MPLKLSWTEWQDVLRVKTQLHFVKNAAVENKIFRVSKNEIDGFDSQFHPK